MAVGHVSWWGRRSGDEQMVLVVGGFICFIAGIGLFVAYNPPPPDLNNTVCYIVMVDKDGGEYTERVSIPVGSSCTDNIIRTTAEPEP